MHGTTSTTREHFKETTHPWDPSLDSCAEQNCGIRIHKLYETGLTNYYEIHPDS